MRPGRRPALHTAREAGIATGETRIGRQGGLCHPWEGTWGFRGWKDFGKLSEAEGILVAPEPRTSVLLTQGDDHAGWSSRLRRKFFPKCNPLAECKFIFNTSLLCHLQVTKCTVPHTWTRACARRATPGETHLPTPGRARARCACCPGGRRRAPQRPCPASWASTRSPSPLPAPSRPVPALSRV